MKKSFLCLICILALCFLTACQAVCPHVDVNDDGICDIADCEKEYKDGIDTICAHQDINRDGKCEFCSENCVYTRQDNIIYFGQYPQTLQTSTDPDLTYSQDPDENGYYLGSDNNYYAKVVLDPNGEGYTFANGQNVIAGETHYFKVEPLRWRIVYTDYSTALIVCDSIIANMAYDAESNNYETSDVRAWLNETFYETAFNELQKSLIAKTLVDNSASSTVSANNPYACNDTEDYVFLLSFSDVTNEAYALDLAARQLRPSDYALANGAFMNQNFANYGYGTWWLRSPYDFDESKARCVYRDGRVYGGSYGSIENDYYGVVPAMFIHLK